MFLILDFTQSFKLALIYNGKSVNKELKIKKNISEILIIEIDKFLKKSHTNIKKIKSIYIITGPGSFTGIRSAIILPSLSVATSPGATLHSSSKSAER